MIPIIEPTSIPGENRIIETPSVDTKKEMYIGFLVNLKIPVDIIFFVEIKGAGDSWFA